MKELNESISQHDIQTFSGGFEMFFFPYLNDPEMVKLT